jgi:hypothetical protein
LLALVSSVLMVTVGLWSWWRFLAPGDHSVWVAFGSVAATTPVAVLWGFGSPLFVVNKRTADRLVRHGIFLGFAAALVFFFHDGVNRMDQIPA